MSDPRFPAEPFGADDKERQRANMAETLQQALRSLGGSGQAAGATGAGPMSPEALMELARRAGISPVGSSDLARAMGVGGTLGGADAGGMPQHIVFGLDDAECALPAAAVDGVERLGDIAQVPNTAPWVLGIVHLRGSILSVVDLRGFFGLPMQPITPRSRLLVVNVREMTIGLVVDGVNEMRTLAEDQVPGGAPEWAAPYAADVFMVDGRRITLLDPERLLFAARMHRYL